MSIELNLALFMEFAQARAIRLQSSEEACPHAAASLQSVEV